MRLSSLLNPKLIVSPLASQDRDLALKEMVRRLCDVVQSDISSDILAAVSAREKFGGFTMGNGVAFPHARTDRVGRVWVVMGTHPAGVAFGPGPGSSARVIVLFVIPKTHAASYLQTLAAFSNLFKNPNHVEEIATAQGPEEIWDYIDGTAVRVREATFVRDLMSPHPGLVSARAPLREGLDILVASGADVVPAVDDAGAYAGALTPRAVVKKGIRTWLTYAGSPAVLSTQAPFEDFLKHHGDLPVSAVLDPGIPTLAEDTTLLEATMTLTRLGRNTAVVLRAGKPVGVLRMADIVRRAIFTRMV
ncbi:MAG: PTS sugar transporter subunit IIA [Candidatus Brocadiae bacterium]|nr:PTS sugar transporter subunit IIA [Candidatus Brocadiia bacterium]